MKTTRPALLLLFIATPLLAEETASSQPATTSRPATTHSATTQAADISPAAGALLSKLAAASAKSAPTQFAGVIVGDFDVAGRAKHFELDVTGRTDGNGRFWHYGRETGLLVSDGTHGYLYDQHRNRYAELQVAAGRCAPSNLDEAVSDVLLDENPALLMTLTTDAGALLRRLATSITLSDSGNGLVLSTSLKRITFDLDPATQALLRSTIDYTPDFVRRGATGVKSAKAVLTYGTPLFPPASDSYTWSPPPTASQFVLHDELIRPADAASGSVPIPPKK